MPGTPLCPRCRGHLEAGPIRLAPRVDPGVPCWALGDYSEGRRATVLAIKEHGRRDLCRPVGSALAGAIGRLRVAGDLDEDLAGPLLIVPAPTRAVAARRRGGDPVVAICRAVAAELGRPPRHRVGRGGASVAVAPILSLDRGAHDSVGLTAAQRRANLAGRLRIRAREARRAIDWSRQRAPGMDPTIVLIDDVLTTGATASESVALLHDSNLPVGAVLVVASGARRRVDPERSIRPTRW
nr:ComF family protein [Millisia brevis]